LSEADTQADHRAANHEVQAIGIEGRPGAVAEPEAVNSARRNELKLKAQPQAGIELPFRDRVSRHLRAILIGALPICTPFSRRGRVRQ
jgi:hypothetical protein